MQDVVGRAQPLRIPVGFEKWTGAEARRIYAVLIGVEHVRQGSFDDPGRELEERARRQEVVLVKEQTIVAAACGERIVGRDGNPAPVLPAKELHTPISRRQRVEPGEVSRSRRPIIDDAQFPIWILLIEHRLDCLFQVGLRRTVNRHEHGKPRAYRPLRCLRAVNGDAVDRVAFLGFQPRGVILVNILDHPMALKYPPQLPAAHNMPDATGDPHQLARIAGRVAKMAL